jgi:hypothetical protein
MLREVEKQESNISKGNKMIDCVKTFDGKTAKGKMIGKGS